MCPFCIASWKPMLTNTNHTPLPSPKTTTNNNDEHIKKRKRKKKRNKRQNICAYTYTNRGRENENQKKSIIFNTISCTSVFFSLVMIVGRCFDIQRAVVLMLYCCRGNYDELFTLVGIFIRRVLSVYSLLFSLSLALKFFRSNFFCYCACYTISCSTEPHVELPFFPYILYVLFSGIWLDSHSCTSFNCIVSGLVLCIWTCKITFNY